MDTLETRMNIVEPSAEHLTLDEAVRIVGLGDKTLRRAVQAGELPRRYVVGARGPHLVFLRADVEKWLDERAVRAGARGRRSPRRAGLTDAPALGQNWAESLAIVTQLQATLEDNGATMASLMARLAQQSSAMVEAQTTITRLVTRLAELEGTSRVSG
jgi:predicted DNA-binding transcriptional regulator AlpA